MSCTSKNNNLDTCPAWFLFNIALKKAQVIDVM